MTKKSNKYKVVLMDECTRVNANLIMMQVAQVVKAEKCPDGSWESLLGTGSDGM